MLDVRTAAVGDIFRLATAEGTENVMFSILGDGDLQINPSDSGVYINDSGVNTDPVLGFQLSDTTKFTMGVDGNSDKFKIYSGDGIGDTSEFVMDTSGDVGIGTAAPVNKLHVEGTASGSAGIYLNSAVPASTASTLYNNGGSLYWSGSELSGGSSKWSGTTDIYYNDGNVGIGTAAPLAKLEVAGTMKINDDATLPTDKKIILDGNDGSDSYLVHNNAGNYVSLFVDGEEVARFKP